MHIEPATNVLWDVFEQHALAFQAVRELIRALQIARYILELPMRLGSAEDNALTARAQDRTPRRSPRGEIARLFSGVATLGRGCVG